PLADLATERIGGHRFHRERQYVPQSRLALEAAPSKVVFVPARGHHDARGAGFEPRHEIIDVGFPNPLAVNVAVGCLPTAYRVVDDPKIAAMPGNRAENAGREILPALGRFPLAGALQVRREDAIRKDAQVLR